MPSWEDRVERHLAEHYGETIYDHAGPCCHLSTIPGAGHNHDCPRHEPSTCPTCKEDGQ